MTAAAYSNPRSFTGKHLDFIGYPIGGMGAGMFTLEGNGGFARFSLRGLPDYLVECCTFSALALKDKASGSVIARVLEGPVPSWKPLFPWDRGFGSAGHGGRGHGYGFPRFDGNTFSTRFPFARVDLQDDSLPLGVEVTGWSPFVPGDADASGLPVGAVEYKFRNTSSRTLEFVYSFHSRNFLINKNEHRKQSVRGTKGGFVLQQAPQEGKPSAEAYFAAWIDDPAAKADLAWFRGGWFDAQTLMWKHIAAGDVVENPAFKEDEPSEGGSVYLPLSLPPGEERTVRLLLGWFAPFSGIREGYSKPAEGSKLDLKKDFYRPWYSTVFAGIDAVIDYWTKENERLRAATATFTDAFYDSTLSAEVLDAVAANLTILKSPTVLREPGGKLWAWEGTCEESGSCSGTCTHVWNYAQALPHLFPAMERSLRETEFFHAQDERGHQDFRSALPLGPTQHTFHAAADGQLGGIIKLYRDWRISGDTTWLKSLWPKARQSLEYCIETWDPDHRGVLLEPHHNTYDIEFWGADGMCSSFYLAALQAAVAMGSAAGEETALYRKLAESGKARAEQELFNGEYFIQKIQWKGLRATSPVEAARVGVNLNYSAEAQALLEKEGPKYQYGDGCLADGVVGEWMAWAAGLPPVLDQEKIASHVDAVYRYNFRENLAKHPNPQRPGYAFNQEAGLLLCTWPRGGALTLPFVYSEEVWTGVEYHIAAHLISYGRIDAGLRIVRAARDRYEGVMRNPYSEFECGHWYARAMSSYSLLQALTGARYDAIEKTLFVHPRLKGDFRSFLAVEGGYGTVGVRDGKAFFELKNGKVDIQRVDYQPA